MASKITCTCGHSWNKSDSSKKDETVCHICGKNNMKNGGWLDKYSDGGFTKCPEGYINIDGNCIKKDSDEYRNLLDQGKVGTMKDDVWYGNKAELEPITIYSNTDKNTQQFYDKLKQYSEDIEDDGKIYETLLDLGQKYGHPKVSMKNTPGFFDPKYSKGSSRENKVRPHYNPFTQRMTIWDDPEQFIDQYIAELSHQKQVMEKGPTDFILKNIGQVPDIITKGYDNLYKTLGSTEYEAHKEIEPSLKNELGDKYIKSSYTKDYYNSPGTFSNENPNIKYKNGGPVQENYNDNTTSYPPGFVGMGNNTQGRNYSPAWGGSFEDGGSIPQAQKGLQTLPPIYTDDPRKVQAYKDSVIMSTLGEDWFNNEMRLKSTQNNPKLKGKNVLLSQERIDNALKNKPIGKRFTGYNYAPDYTQVETTTKGDKVINTKSTTTKGKKTPTYKNTYAYPKQEYIYKAPPITPIYVNNPNDPRLKSYTDSLSLYNKTKDIQNPKYYTDGDPSWYNWKGNRRDSENFMKKNNIDLDYEYYRTGKFPGKIQPIKTGDFGEGMAYPIYKKPIQPYLFQKEPSIKPNQFTQQQLINPNTEFNPDITELQHPDITLPTIAPRFPKGDYQYVYGPANSTIGRNYNGQFYPEDIPEQRGKVNQPDLDLLNNDAALRKYVQQKSLKYAMGGSIPGATGFSYGRIGDIPSNGKYAKKTLASAQNGKEMSYYQNGLDWKPRNISRDGSVIKDDMGYWNPNNHGKVVEISSPDITMEGVYQPLLGISDTGDTKLMKPGKNYKFKGKKVTEFPVGKNGVNQQDQKTYQQLDQLMNFNNKGENKKWLDKY